MISKEQLHRNSLIQFEELLNLELDHTGDLKKTQEILERLPKGMEKYQKIQN